MSEDNIILNDLGHLCDDFNQLSPSEKELIILDIQNHIQKLLPGYTISNKPARDLDNIQDYFADPPLKIEEARIFVDNIRIWAYAKGYDFCPCTLLFGIEKLSEESL